MNKHWIRLEDGGYINMDTVSITHAPDNGDIAVFYTDGNEGEFSGQDAENIIRYLELVS